MHKHTKRRKYCNNDVSKPGYSLEPGMKGFLCTFNSQEKGCVRESYNILNKYADRLYGVEKLEDVPNQQEIAESSIEDDLEKEVKELKAENENVEKRRFQVVKSGAKNVLFVRTSVDDPVKLASAIVDDIKETKQSQTRFLIRLVPIEITCKAYVDDIKKSCSSLLEKHFKDNNKSFSIAYNRRNNNHLDRDEVIKETADLVIKLFGDHKVNLTQPDITIIIEVIKSVALLAVVPNYIMLKKFNLHSFVQNELKETDNAEAVKSNDDKKVIEDNEDSNVVECGKNENLMKDDDTVCKE